MAENEKAISGDLIVAAEILCKKWHVSDFELVEEIKDGKLSVLFCNKQPRKDQSGTVLYLCSTGTSKNIYCHSDFSSGNSYCDLSGVYLFKGQVDEHERQRPHLLLDLAININESDGELVDIDNKYISFLQLKDAARLSVAQLRDIVIKYEIQVYHEERDDCGGVSILPYDIRQNGFRDWIINEGLFDMLDIRPHKDGWPELDRLFAEDQKPYTSTDYFVSDLERQLRELRQENESLKAGGSSVESAQPDCAACPQNNDQRLEVFKIGVRMALRCAADGSPQSKEGHLALWRELHGGKGVKPNSRYFDAFRTVLDEAPHLKCPDPRQK